MSKSQYNQQIDTVLADKAKNNSFMKDELSDLVISSSKKIYRSDKSVPIEELEVIVKKIILDKYQKTTKKNQTIYVRNPEIESDSTYSSDIDIGSLDCANTNSGSDSEISLPDNISPVSSDGNYTSVKSMSKKPSKSSSLDLIDHTHDYVGTKFKNSDHIRRQNRIVEIKKIPQFEQKSAEWLEQRKECLTATAIAIALDEDSHKDPAYLLLEKCGRCPDFMENLAVHHGKKYEEIANMYYGFRNNIKVAEYGMIQHAKYNFVGASPDGICEKNAKDGVNLSTLVGRLVEIKCPYSRKIKLTGNLDGDIIPHDYYVQAQTQLFVTELDECDFLQCEIGEYDSWNKFVSDSDPNIPTLSKETGLEKGCLIQLLPRKFVLEPSVYDPDEARIEPTEQENLSDEYMTYLLRAQYIYPDELHLSVEQTEKWIATQVANYHTHKLFKTHMIDRVIYFKFNKISCHLVKKDPVWFQSKIPILEQFWSYILFYREYPKKLNDLVKYVKEVGIKNTAIIFEKVNKDYVRINKKSKYEPLYQEKNPWRIKHDKTAAFFANRNKNSVH